MVISKSALAAVVLSQALFGTVVANPVSDLIFTGYIEGSSLNKVRISSTASSKFCCPSSSDVRVFHVLLTVCANLCIDIRS
jgi:hypothetical protein